MSCPKYLKAMGREEEDGIKREMKRTKKFQDNCELKYGITADKNKMVWPELHAVYMKG